MSIPGDTYAERALAGTLSGRYDSTPKWSTSSSSSSVSSVTGNYTATKSDNVIEVSAAGGPATITLPTAVGINGTEYSVKKTDSGTNAVTIQPSNSQTIDGNTNSILTTKNEDITVVSDGSNWVII